MRILVWLIRAALFFTLFAFALNNQHDASIRWFFSHEWRAPMVFIVLAAFTLGCVVGGLAMAPSWWRHRRIAKRHQVDALADDPVLLAPSPPDTPLQPPSDTDPTRHGV
jgi:lipopolysaccharide assembly protein A